MQVSIGGVGGRMGFAFLPSGRYCVGLAGLAEAGAFLLGASHFPIDGTMRLAKLFMDVSWNGSPD